MPPHGEDGARGFVVAYQASSGERVLQFWTLLALGEK